MKLYIGWRISPNPLVEAQKNARSNTKPANHPCESAVNRAASRDPHHLEGEF
jgi:hypothetical protein